MRHYSTISCIVIGTELTRGIIGDKHGQLMAQELTHIGYHVNSITVVPDDGSVREVLLESLKTSDVILLTGGLGPTSDDMTRSIVAEVAHVSLQQHDEAFAALFARIGDRIWGANQRQVFIPEGFSPIPNPLGTACGFHGIIRHEQAGKIQETLCYAMPGPPVEMHEMFYTRILPELAKLAGHDEHERDEYSCFLISESRLEEICAECAVEGVFWGTRAQEYRISLYLSGKDAQSRFLMAQRIEDTIGKGVLHVGNVTAENMLSTLMKEQHMRIATAESCTGGLVSKLMTDLAGSSAWFWGGVVSYANSAKHILLDIESRVLDTYGAVSQETVSHMASSMRKKSGVELACAVSGIAGPSGGSVEKPVGTVCFAYDSSFRASVSISLTFSSYGRASVRKRAAIAAILLAFFYIKGSDLLDMVDTWQYI